MKSFLPAGRRHRLALYNAGLVIPEVAETLLTNDLTGNGTLFPRHVFSLLCTHLEPDNGCGYFDFALYSPDALAASVRKRFTARKKSLRKKTESVTGEHGSSCSISDLFLLSEQPNPPPLAGMIIYGRYKIDLNRSSFHIADAAAHISEDWDFAGAEDALNRSVPCRLTRIDIDFAQEPELFFQLTSPLPREYQLPDNMAEVTRTAQALLVRLMPQSLTDASTAIAE